MICMDDVHQFLAALVIAWFMYTWDTLRWLHFYVSIP